MELKSHLRSHRPNHRCRNRPRAARWSLAAHRNRSVTCRSHRLNRRCRKPATVLVLPAGALPPTEVSPVGAIARIAVAATILVLPAGATPPTGVLLTRATAQSAAKCGSICHVEIYTCLCE